MKLSRIIFTFLSVIILFVSTNSFSKEIRFVTEDMPPMQTIGRDGKPTGYNVELIREILKVAKIKSEVEILPWKRALKLAETQKNTFIFSMVRNTQREDKFKWVIQLNSLTANLTALTSSNHINIDTTKDIKKYRIAVSRGDFGEEYLKSIGLDENNNLYTTPNYKNMWRMLFKGRVDAVFTSNRTGHLEISEAGLRPSLTTKVWEFDAQTKYVYLATNLETDPELIEAVSSAYRKVIDSEFHRKLGEKWQMD